MADFKKPLIAVKTLRYGNRRLLPDDGFQASPRDARLLVAIGKARYATTSAVVGGAPPMVSDLAALRATYFEKTGKRAFNGWNADVLQAKLAEA